MIGLAISVVGLLITILGVTITATAKMTRLTVTVERNTVEIAVLKETTAETQTILIKHTGGNGKAVPLESRVGGIEKALGI